MVMRRSMIAALDAVLLRLFALAMFGLARGWLAIGLWLRARRLLGTERFRAELCRAARINRLGLRALHRWLEMTGR